MRHLRPIRSGARNVRDDRGLKESWRSETFYAPQSVRTLFAEASLHRRAGKGGNHLVKLRGETRARGGSEIRDARRVVELQEETPARIASEMRDRIRRFELRSETLGTATSALTAQDGLSLRDAAFALDAAQTGPWTVKTSLAVPMFPAFPGGPISLRALTRRFSASGAALRSLANGNVNLWSHMNRTTIVSEISDRLRDPMIIMQNPTGLCGPISIMMELIRRAPARFVRIAKELLETGQFVCPTGRVIFAEQELREEPVIAGDIGQVDWLLAATMRDDENIWEDVDDDANGLESMTFWGEQRDWTRDVIGLPFGGWETCFSWGEITCMKKAQNAVNAGGVAFFLVDANVLKDGGDDDEEDMRWRRGAHTARQAPAALGNLIHSEDDAFPPDHWVGYLGGLALGANPGDDDPVSIRLWSWGREYLVTGTVDAFTEYLYGVVTGTE